MSVIDQIPKSRLTIKYRTEINGKEQDKEIPFRLLVLGDLSKGTSEDRKLELEERSVRELDGKNLNSTMNDMKMRLNLTVDNKINPDKAADLDISLPIKSIKSFNPATIVEEIPQLKALLLLKKMVKELETNTDNNKAFRRSLGSLLTDKDKYEKLKLALPDSEVYKLPGDDAEIIDLMDQ